MGKSARLGHGELPGGVRGDAHGPLAHAMVAVAQRQHVVVACFGQGAQPLSAPIIYVSSCWLMHAVAESNKSSFAEYSNAWNRCKDESSQLPEQEGKKCRVAIVKKLSLQCQSRQWRNLRSHLL